MAKANIRITVLGGALFVGMACGPPPEPGSPGPAPAPEPAPAPAPAPEPDPAPGEGPSGGPSGSCDEVYGDAAEYRSNSRRSSGAQNGLSTGSRATFVATRSTDARPMSYAAAGLELGGEPIHRALVLKFRENGALEWGKSFSHCSFDEAESVATFADGSLAVSTTYLIEEGVRTELLKLSPSGAILWRHLLVASDCTARACYDRVHSEVEIDHYDETVIAAVRTGEQPLEIVRVGSDGSELGRGTISADEAGASDLKLASLDVYEGGGSARSDVLVGLRQGMMLLRSDFSFAWLETRAGGAHYEVAMCQPDRYTTVAVGSEYFSTDHVVASYAKGGSELWSWRVAGGGSESSSAYGVVRGDLFNLHCTEQDTPELVMRSSDGSSESAHEVTGLLLKTDGTIHRIYDADLSPPGRLAGSAGVGLSGDALLVLKEGKFAVIPSEGVGWTRR